ncbi:bone marrow stromal antigen 2-like [Sorex fumeus]|uniref:bone marrow stromal antigen 2-like n=1 Tax=Sorex fumeus TaxID=62283 RepID=UPI0024ADD081|nr:bone marrow stromal antigen 2-like [Sorex fumeus]
MAPTFYHFAPALDLEMQNLEMRKLRCWQYLAVILGVLLLFLLFPLGYLCYTVSHPAYLDDLRAHKLCHNTTSLLEQQLDQTRRELGDAQKQVASYNQTVVTLMESLEMKEKEHHRKMQEKEEQHQREIQALKQQLQEALKKPAPPKSDPARENKSQGELNSGSCQVSLNTWVLPGLLLLWALRFL